MAKRLFGKAIGARSARKLIREIGGVPDEELAAEFGRVVHPLSRPEEEIVCLKDGRVVHVFYGSANIYASAAEFLNLLAFIDERSRREPRHPLGTGFPAGKGFIEAVPRLAGELPAKLGLSAGVLDGSVKSLEHIDDAARRIGGQVCLDDPATLAPIVAYVGEVMRGAVGGRWEIRHWQGPGADGNWQPAIIGANGAEYPIFVIFKDLLEEGSIFAVVSCEIGNRRL